MWIVGSAFIIWFARRIKRVEADEKLLYIADYFSEVTIPLAEVADLTENRWSRPPTVTIHFHIQTHFGKRVVFIPKFRPSSSGLSSGDLSRVAESL